MSIEGMEYTGVQDICLTVHKERIIKDVSENTKVLDQTEMALVHLI